MHPLEYSCYSFIFSENVCSYVCNVCKCVLAMLWQVTLTSHVKSPLLFTFPWCGFILIWSQLSNPVLLTLEPCHFWCSSCQTLIKATVLVLCSHLTIIKKNTVQSWASQFQPSRQHTGPPFCLKKSHLKSYFDQNKKFFHPSCATTSWLLLSRWTCPPLHGYHGYTWQPQPAQGGLLRWSEGPHCICTTCAKIWRAIEHHEVVGGPWPPNLFLLLIFLSFLFLLICWYMTPAGECWPEASRKREQLNVAWLWRALCKFCTDSEQSVVSCWKMAKKRG